MSDPLSAVGANGAAVGAAASGVAAAPDCSCVCDAKGPSKGQSSFDRLLQSLQGSPSSPASNAGDASFAGDASGAGNVSSPAFDPRMPWYATKLGMLDTLGLMGAPTDGSSTAASPLSSMFGGGGGLMESPLMQLLLQDLQRMLDLDRQILSALSKMSGAANAPDAGTPPQTSPAAQRALSAPVSPPAPTTPPSPSVPALRPTPPVQGDHEPHPVPTVRALGLGAPFGAFPQRGPSGPAASPHPTAAPPAATPAATPRAG